jgi:hypothetical protein
VRPLAVAICSLAPPLASSQLISRSDTNQDTTQHSVIKRHSIHHQIEAAPSDETMVSKYLDEKGAAPGVSIGPYDRLSFPFETSVMHALRLALDGRDGIQCRGGHLFCY